MILDIEGGANTIAIFSWEGREAEGCEGWWEKRGFSPQSHSWTQVCWTLVMAMIHSVIVFVQRLCWHFQISLVFSKIICCRSGKPLEFIKSYLIWCILFQNSRLSFSAWHPGHYFKVGNDSIHQSNDCIYSCTAFEMHLFPPWSRDSWLIRAPAKHIAQGLPFQAFLPVSVGLSELMTLGQ